MGNNLSFETLISWKYMPAGDSSSVVPVLQEGAYRESCVMFSLNVGMRVLDTGMRDIFWQLEL